MISLMHLPLGLIALAGAYALVPVSRRAARQAFVWLGSALFAISAIGLL